VDLAHKTRWDLQNGQVGELTTRRSGVPQTPGECTFAGHTLINRMNRTQAAIYHLGAAAPVMPDFPGYTDVSEATLFVALFGPNAFRVAEKLTNLDFLDPAKTAPFLLQGPFCHVPCQIVTLEKDADGTGGFLLDLQPGLRRQHGSRHLEAGAEFGLRPAGENRFRNWIQGIQK
jgi:hypothetical protein